MNKYNILHWKDGKKESAGYILIEDAHIEISPNCWHIIKDTEELLYELAYQITGNSGYWILQKVDKALIKIVQEYGNIYHDYYELENDVYQILKENYIC